jgi:hypothetical protein
LPHRKKCNKFFKKLSEKSSSSQNFRISSEARKNASVVNLYTARRTDETTAEIAELQEKGEFGNGLKIRFRNFFKFQVSLAMLFPKRL